MFLLTELQGSCCRHGMLLKGGLEVNLVMSEAAYLRRGGIPC